MCNNARAPRNRSGAFTLLEVLVALTIFSVAILAILAAFNLSQRASSHAANLQDATALARNQLELAVDRPANRLAAREGKSGLFTWTVDYAEKSPGLVMATAMVHWQERGETKVFHVSQLFKPAKKQ